MSAVHVGQPGHELVTRLLGAVAAGAEPLSSADIAGTAGSDGTSDMQLPYPYW